MSLVSDVHSVSSLFFAFSVPCNFFLAKPHVIYWVKGIAVSRPLVMRLHGIRGGEVSVVLWLDHILLTCVLLDCERLMFLSSLSSPP